MTEPQQPGFGQQPPLSKKEAKAQAAAAKAYSKSQRSWFAKHKILTALGAFILLAIGHQADASGGGGGDDTVTAGNGSSDLPMPLRPLLLPSPRSPRLCVSAKEMIAVLEGNALKAKNTYEGKRVTVSGVVGNIDASGDYFALDPEPDAFILAGIQVRTSDKFQDQVANFTADQAVTVTGKITDVGEIMGYSLKAETIK